MVICIIIIPLDRIEYFLKNNPGAIIKGSVDISHLVFDDLYIPRNLSIRVKKEQRVFLPFFYKGLKYLTIYYENKQDKLNNLCTFILPKLDVLEIYI